MAFRNEAFSFFSHAIGALIALVGLIMLIAYRAHDALAIAAFAIYGGTMIGMFITSALHHVAHAEEGLFRKLDMSAIYLFIAGSYTPFCLIGMPRAWGIPMLVAIWTFGLAGVILRWTLPKTPRWATAVIYLVMGWMSLVGIWPIYDAFGIRGALLLVGGGVVYSIGAVVYARQSPDPLPQYIGYHGLWHVFVLAGAAVHFVLVWGLTG